MNKSDLIEALAKKQNLTNGRIEIRDSGVLS